MNRECKVSVPGETVASGHPPGLWVLCFSEFWERFSFYGLRALLVFYLVQEYNFSDAQAFVIYGSYSALIYAATIFGGVFSARFLGYKRAVIYGSILMLIGHVIMAILAELHTYSRDFQAMSSMDQVDFLYIALTFLIVGVGLLKPSISAMVGELYVDDSHKKDAAYTYFFMGIMGGSLLATVGCGYLGMALGWHYGFGAAAVGLLIGLVVFMAGDKHIRTIGGKPKFKTVRNSIYDGGLTFVVMTLSLFAFLYLMRLPEVLGTFLLSICVLTYGYVIYRAFAVEKPDQRKSTFFLLLLMGMWIIFAALLEQGGMSVNLFTARHVDLSVVGEMSLQPAQLKGFLPLFLILLAPLFARLWDRIGDGGNDTRSTLFKFSMSFVFVGFGFLVISYAGYFTASENLIAMRWLIIAYFMHAIGDLLINPIGLSAISKRCSSEMAGTMMGVWYLSLAAGNFFAARIAAFSRADSEADGLTTDISGASLDHYSSFFGTVGLSSVAFGLVFGAVVYLRFRSSGVRRSGFS